MAFCWVEPKKEPIVLLLFGKVMKGWGKVKIKIYHINDLNGYYEGMSRLSTALKEHGTINSIILDGGNNPDFMRWETEGSKGEISSALLNEIGTTARVFGNSEAFSGPENARVISESSNFPSLSCNIYQINGEKFPYLKDYMIKQVEDIRVLIIGVTASRKGFDNLYGISVKDPRTEIERVLREVKQSQYDLTILLSHLGRTAEREIAKHFGEIDIIVSGNSPNIVEKEENINRTIICQAGSRGRFLGKIEIEYDLNKKRSGYSWKLIDCNLFPPDFKIYYLIDKYTRLAKRNLSKPLYNIKTALNHSSASENLLGNLLADGLKDFQKTEIGLINTGVLERGLEAGEITKKLLIEVCPLPFHPAYLELQGKDLLQILEKSLLPEYYQALGPGEGIRDNCLGNIAVSNNVVVTYQNNAEPMNKIIEVTIDRKPLEGEQWYSVGTSDFLEQGSSYEDFRNGRKANYQPEFLRDILAKYLKKWRFIRKAKQKRFKQTESSDA